MVMSSAKAVVEKRVDFKTPFSDVPVVVVNANSATPNDVDVNAGSVDANGFSVFLYRGTNTNTHVAWLAVLYPSFPYPMPLLATGPHCKHTAKLPCWMSS